MVFQRFWKLQLKSVEKPMEITRARRRAHPMVLSDSLQKGMDKENPDPRVLTGKKASTTSTRLLALDYYHSTTITRLLALDKASYGCGCGCGSGSLAGWLAGWRSGSVEKPMVLLLCLANVLKNHWFYCYFWHDLNPGQENRPPYGSLRLSPERDGQREP